MHYLSLSIVLLYGVVFSRNCGDTSWDDGATYGDSGYFDQRGHFLRDGQGPVHCTLSGQLRPHGLCSISLGYYLGDYAGAGHVCAVGLCGPLIVILMIVVSISVRKRQESTLRSFTIRA